MEKKKCLYEFSGGKNWKKQGGEERVADNKEYTYWTIGLDQNQEGKKSLGGTTRK